MKISLATLSQFSKQEVFEHIVKHLIRQNERSLTLTGEPAFRGKRGLKCSSGCLIADKEYTPGMENKFWEQLVDNGTAPSHYTSMIMKLQTVHDYFYPYTNWIDKIRAIARMEGLSVEFLDNIKD